MSTPVSASASPPFSDTAKKAAYATALATRKLVAFLDMDNTITNSTRYPVSSERIFNDFKERELAGLPEDFFITGALDFIVAMQKLGVKVCVVTHAYNGYEEILVAALAARGVILDALVSTKHVAEEVHRKSLWKIAEEVAEQKLGRKPIADEVVNEFYILKAELESIYGKGAATYMAKLAFNQMKILKVHRGDYSVLMFGDSQNDLTFGSHMHTDFGINVLCFHVTAALDIPSNDVNLTREAADLLRQFAESRQQHFDVAEVRSFHHAAKVLLLEFGIETGVLEPAQHSTSAAGSAASTSSAISASAAPAARPLRRSSTVHNLEALTSLPPANTSAAASTAASALPPRPQTIREQIAEKLTTLAELKKTKAEIEAEAEAEAEGYQTGLVNLNIAINDERNALVALRRELISKLEAESIELKKELQLRLGTLPGQLKELDDKLSSGEMDGLYYGAHRESLYYSIEITENLIVQIENEIKHTQEQIEAELAALSSMAADSSAAAAGSAASSIASVRSQVAPASVPGDFVLVAVEEDDGAGDESVSGFVAVESGRETKLPPISAEQARAAVAAALAAPVADLRRRPPLHPPIVLRSDPSAASHAATASAAVVASSAPPSAASTHSTARTSAINSVVQGMLSGSEFADFLRQRSRVFGFQPLITEPVASAAVAGLAPSSAAAAATVVAPVPTAEELATSTAAASMDKSVYHSVVSLTPGSAVPQDAIVSAAAAAGVSVDRPITRQPTEPVLAGVGGAGAPVAPAALPASALGEASAESGMSSGLSGCVREGHF